MLWPETLLYFSFCTLDAHEPVASRSVRWRTRLVMPTSSCTLVLCQAYDRTAHR